MARPVFLGICWSLPGIEIEDALGLTALLPVSMGGPSVSLFPLRDVDLLSPLLKLAVLEAQ